MRGKVIVAVVCIVIIIMGPFRRPAWNMDVNPVYNMDLHRVRFVKCLLWGSKNSSTVGVGACN